jgi:uncharacterized protein (TIGR03083 family)
MDEDAIWQVIDTQRTSLTLLLEKLTDDQWRQPSLCTGWTMRDVTAHLALQQLGVRDVFAMLAHWRGSTDRTIQHMARRHAAARTNAQLIAEIRGMVGSRRHTLGVTYLEVLSDNLIHAQDIAIPLGLHHDMPPEAAAVSATRLLSMRWPPPLPSIPRLAGFRLVATDVAWSHGTGPEVHGPMSALLLACAGRTAALPGLSGDGRAGLSAALRD